MSEEGVLQDNHPLLTQIQREVIYQLYAEGLTWYEYCEDSNVVLMGNTDFYVIVGEYGRVSTDKDALINLIPKFAPYL